MVFLLQPPSRRRHYLRYDPFLPPTKEALPDGEILLLPCNGA
jgi:hypothetical protein